MDKYGSVEDKERARGAGEDMMDEPEEEGSDWRRTKKPRIGDHAGNLTKTPSPTETTTVDHHSRSYPKMTSARRKLNAHGQPTTRGEWTLGAAGGVKTAGTGSSEDGTEHSSGTLNARSMDGSDHVCNGENSLENSEEMAAAMLCSIMAPSTVASATATTTSADADAANTQGNCDTFNEAMKAKDDQLSENKRYGLQRREELAVSMLCRMAPKREEELPPPLSRGSSHTNREHSVNVANSPSVAKDAITINSNKEKIGGGLCSKVDIQKLESLPNVSSANRSNGQSEGVVEPQMPGRSTATSMIERKDVTQSQHFLKPRPLHSLESGERKKLQQNETMEVVEDPEGEMHASDEEGNEDGKTKKKRRRDLSKPTLDSLVQDKFGGDVFHFLECVETEMNQHNFTATGLARKYGAVNCQSRFRTIVAELKEEPIVGMSRLWKERVQAYLRSKRGEDVHMPDEPVDERLRLVKRSVKKSTDKEANKARLMQNSDEKLAATALCTMAPSSDEEPEVAPPPRKRHRPMVDESAKTTLDVLVQEKFGGDTFRFLESIEMEMNKDGFTATGLARKYGAVNCQSRFRTIVAELKGEPIVGMSRLWKERVQAYLRSKESGEGLEEDPLTSEGAFQEDTLRLVQDNSKCKPPGTVGMFVRQNFGSDFNRFLGSLEEEMKVPGFTAAGYARRHQITEGKKMLVNIVAELQGLPNTTMTQTWKDRVHTYLAAKGKGDEGLASQCPASLEEGQTPSCEEESGTIVEDNNSEKGSDDVYIEDKIESETGNPMSLRFTEEGHPLGILDTLVQEKFDGDVFSFLEYLERDIRTPDFTAGTFARKHGVTGGKRTLQRIVAQLKGESAHSSQMWKDRVQAYIQFKGGSQNIGGRENIFARIATGDVPRVSQIAPDNTDENNIVENPTALQEEMYAPSPVVGI